MLDSACNMANAIHYAIVAASVRATHAATVAATAALIDILLQSRTSRILTRVSVDQCVVIGSTLLSLCDEAAIGCKLQRRLLRV